MPPIESLEDIPIVTEFDHPPPDIEALRWRRPDGWQDPPWLPEEPAAGLPMSPARMAWCLAAIGWSPAVLAERLDGNERNFRRMRSGKSNIPDQLAGWLEQLAAAVLAQPLHPPHWRPRIWRKADGTLRGGPGPKNWQEDEASSDSS